MKPPSSKRLLWYSLSCVVVALLLWTVLYFRNPLLKDVLWEIHTIFLSTLGAYFLIKMFVPSLWIDMFKIFIRTMFRVWLLIFITFAITKSMERVGFILSITFIFGYFEGLLDIDKWLQHGKLPGILSSAHLAGSRRNQALASMMMMSIIHCVCALVVLLFYLLY
jgi:hypothetical protein